MSDALELVKPVAGGPGAIREVPGQPEGLFAYSAPYKRCERAQTRWTVLKV